MIFEIGLSLKVRMILVVKLMVVSATRIVCFDDDETTIEWNKTQWTG